MNGEKIVYDKNTKQAKAADQCDRAESRKGDDMLFEEEAVGAGDKFGAVLPFLGALVEPSKHPPINPAEPTEDYKLEYVYGYRTYDCRQNLFFVAGGKKIVFNVAALGITLDVEANTQSFFGGGTISKATKGTLNQHDDDIICLSISADRKYVATGQVGAMPSLYIWDAETGKLKNPKSFAKAKAKNLRAFGCCAWSGDGKYVAYTDKSEKRNVYVIEAETGTQVYTEADGGQDIFDISWSKKAGDNRFATAGAKHINFYDLTAKTKKTGTGHGAQSFSCVTFDDNGICYAGGVDGQIYVFKENALSGKKPAHKGVIHTVNWMEGKLYTGGNDKNLCIFGEGAAAEKTINLSSIPRAIDVMGDRILVGMRNGTICIVTAGTPKEIFKSHHDGEVWGLEVTENGEVLTTCDDNKLMIWNAKERKSKAVAIINDKAGERIKYGASSMTAFPDNQCSRAVCYNAKSNEIAVATNSGEVQIRDFSKPEVVKKSLKSADRWIEFMCYSPNGEYLAVGTHSNAIVIYDTAAYTEKGKNTAHKSSILSLDWSKDGKYIRSNCEAYELLFFDLQTMKQDPSGATNTKDTEWQSQYTKIGWSVTGVFPKGTSGNHVNGVCMSADGKLIATGDDWGLVNIYRNPCREGSQPKSFRYIS